MKSIISFIFDADSLAGKIICPLIYILLYDFIYEEYIWGVFGYMRGIDYIPMDFFKRVSWIILSVLPMIFYHRINELSTFICLFVYIFVYIPFIHALFVIYGFPLSLVYAYTTILCIFFILYFQIDRIPLIKNIQLGPVVPIYIVEIITLLLTGIFVASRAGSMHFVNIFTQMDVLYDLREQNSEKVGERNIILYLQGWLVGAFYPFLLIWYLKYKSHIKATCILIGYILLFMVDMQKSTFFIPFLLITFYYLIKTKENVICDRLHSIILLSISAISFILIIVSDSDNNSILFTITSIVLLRTVCVTGWLTQMYVHFFQENPYTYYSHINIVNAITNGYPYDVPLGMAVAYHNQNANATFFLTEGIASCGLTGIIITGFIFLAFLYILNSLCFRYHKSDIFVAFIPSLISLLNASIFSTLLTGGLFILLLLFGICNPQEMESGKIEISDSN